MQNKLGQIIRDRIDELNGVQKKDLAATWFETYLKRGGEGGKVETAISRLSDLMSNNMRGVRFFFAQDSLRTEVLFEVLGLSEAVRSEVQACADALRGTNGGAPLVIFDIARSNIPQASLPSFFAALHPLLARLPARPVAIVVTAQQWNAVPRNFDELELGREIDRCETESEAEDLVGKLDHPGAWVATTRFNAPLSRWLALSFTKDQLLTSPANLLSEFAEPPKTSPPAEDARLLSDLGVERCEAAIPNDAVKLRETLCAISDPQAAATLKMTPQLRRALGDQFGIQAVATETEQVELELKMVYDSTGTRPFQHHVQLETILSVGRVIRLSPIAYQRAGVLHIINPSSDVPQTQRLNITVHNVEPEQPALTTLMDAIADWTEDDWLADPVLDRLVEILTARHGALERFRHARDYLLSRKEVYRRADPARPADWRQALAELLSGDLPEARLLVPSASSNILIDRAKMVVNEVERSNSNQSDGPDPKQWLAQYLASHNAWLSKYAGVAEDRTGAKSTQPRRYRVRVEPSVWSAADRLLAVSCVTVSSALTGRACGVRDRSGRITLALPGTGVMACIDVRYAPAWQNKEITGALNYKGQLEVDRERDPDDGYRMSGSREMDSDKQLTEFVECGRSHFRGDVQRNGLQVPSGVMLLGRGLAATITFIRALGTIAATPGTPEEVAIDDDD